VRRGDALHLRKLRLLVSTHLSYLSSAVSRPKFELQPLLSVLSLKARTRGEASRPASSRHSDTRGTPRGLFGSRRLNHAPFEVDQVISAHADPESEFDAMSKPPVGKRPMSDLKGVSDDAPKQSFNRMA
jgi:hypothetical protein